jgi:hypothetical protein
MPDWILAPLCLVFLLGFIGYALRQGTKVSADRTNNGGSDLPGIGSDGGSDGGGHSF